MATLDKSCSCCREDQLSAHRPPRPMIELPTQARNGKTVYACEHCDGPVVTMARRKGSK